MIAEPEKLKTLFELGYDNSAYWQVKPCQLDKQLSQICPLSAFMSPMARKIKNLDQYLPVKLNCLNGDTGIFELFQKDGFGRIARLQITYKDNKAIRVSLSSAENVSSRFDEGLQFDLTKNLESFEKRIAEHLLGMLNTLRQNVCSVLVK